MFMRTETEIHKREILAVWIKSCMSHVQDDYNKVTAAIKQTDMGKNAEKRDFLLTTSNATYITQGINNIRRSCIAIFLDKLPPQLAAELKKGSCTHIMVCTMHIYVIDKHLSKKQKFIQSKIHFTQQSVKFVCVVHNNRKQVLSL